MKPILVAALIFLSTTLTMGQKTDYSKDLLNQLENPKERTDSLTSKNYLNEYNTFDFSTLFTPRLEFLGYIGKDYKRFKIYFTTISKDSANPNLYRLKGISVVDKIKCNFEGTIIVLQIRKLKTIHYGLDDSMKKTIKAQGLLIAKYEFREDKNQPHSGIFLGNMFLRWYVDNLDILHYDEIEYYSDSYNNLQFAGTWESYVDGLKKTCNWGYRRIPFSNELDMGAGEFSPDPKFRDKGWEDLMIK